MSVIKTGLALEDGQVQFDASLAASKYANKQRKETLIPLNASANAVRIEGTLSGTSSVELIQEAFSAATHTAVAVTSSNISVLAANADRRVLEIQNTGNNPCEITFGSSAGTVGLVVLPYGQLGIDSPGIRWTGAVRAAKDSAGNTILRVLEI